MPLAGVESQSVEYAAGLPALVSPLPFLYESTGDETMFTDGFDPEPRSRPVVAFHRPETLVRDDFWASTSNKQLNFLQHIKDLSG